MAWLFFAAFSLASLRLCLVIASVVRDCEASGSQCVLCPQTEAVIARSDNGELELNEGFLERLRSMRGELRVRCRLGLYRSGKSVASTLDARSRLRPPWRDQCPVYFQSGAGGRGVTSGVLGLLLPADVLEGDGDSHELLLDMDGLGDTLSGLSLEEKARVREAVDKEFVFTTLLCGDAYLHVSRNLDSATLRQLSGLTFLTKLAATSSPEVKASWTQLAPRLIGLVIDGSLFEDEPNMTSGSYRFDGLLEQALANSEEGQDIKEFFKDRRFFVTPRVGDAELKFFKESLHSTPGLESGGHGLGDFTESLLNVLAQNMGSTPSKMFGGKRITGATFAWLAERLFEALIESQPGMPFGQGMTPQHMYQSMCTSARKQDVRQLDVHLAGLRNTLPMEEDALLVMVRDSAAYDGEDFQKLSVLIPVDALSQCSATWVQSRDEKIAHFLQINSMLNVCDWVAGDWSECFDFCPGHRTRHVSCQREDGLIVADEKCKGKTSPTSIEPCPVSVQKYTWRAVELGSCEGTCPGWQSFAVECVDCSQNVVASSHCLAERPADRVACDAYTFDWRVRDDGACEGHCPSRKRRLVDCLRCGEVVVDESSCQAQKPETSVLCDYAYSWEAGPWSGCSRTDCGGHKGLQDRSVRCQRCDGVEVDSACVEAHRPPASMDCWTPSCPPPPPPPPPPPDDRRRRNRRRVFR